MDIRKIINKLTPVIMLLPALLGIMLVQILPSLDSTRLSFFNKSLLRPAVDFVGLENYIDILKNPTNWQIIFNTLFFSIFSLLFGTIFAMIVANELNKEFRGRTLLRALFLSPWVTPPLVTSIIWQLMLSESFSPLSRLLMDIGIISRPINFLGNTNTVLGIFSMPMLSLITINVWSIFPFLMVMFLAGLQTIPAELLEAATVDGANSVQRFFRITLPSLLPVIETSILLEGIWQFNNFNLSYLVTKGGPLNLTRVMAVSVYTEAFTNFKYSYGAAVSVIMMLILVAPVTVYLKKSLNTNQNI